MPLDLTGLTPTNPEIGICAGLPGSQTGQTKGQFPTCRCSRHARRGCRRMSRTGMSEVPTRPDFLPHLQGKEEKSTPTPTNWCQRVPHDDHLSAARSLSSPISLSVGLQWRCSPVLISFLPTFHQEEKSGPPPTSWCPIYEP